MITSFPGFGTNAIFFRTVSSLSFISFSSHSTFGISWTISLRNNIFFGSMIFFAKHCNNKEKYALYFVQIIALSVPVKFRLSSITRNTRMTPCQHSWIINELCVNIRKNARNCVQMVALSVPVKFRLSIITGNTKMTPCQHSWIINELCVNIRKNARNCVQVVALSVPVKFHLSIITGNAKMTPCQHSWIINEFPCHYQVIKWISRIDNEETTLPPSEIGPKWHFCRFNVIDSFLFMSDH